MEDEMNLRDGREKDGPLVLRALIHHRWMSPAGRWTQFISLYPAGQYRSTEDLHAFDLALKERLRTMDWYKVTVVRGECVTVRSMSRALYSMDGLQGMCTARSWLGLGLAVLRMRCRAGIEKTISAVRGEQEVSNGT
jgi:hypothetical protein